MSSLTILDQQLLSYKVLFTLDVSRMCVDGHVINLVVVVGIGHENCRRLRLVFLPCMT